MASASAPTTAAVVEKVDSVVGSSWLASREAQVVAATWKTVLTAVKAIAHLSFKVPTTELYWCFLLLGIIYRGEIAEFFVLPLPLLFLVPLLQVPFHGPLLPILSSLPFFYEPLFPNGQLSWHL